MQENATLLSQDLLTRREEKVTGDYVSDGVESNCGYAVLENR